MKSRKKLIPEFSTEAEERSFWSAQDSTDYVDWAKAEKVLLPNLKPTMKTYVCSTDKRHVQ